jgi:hypothetical protein
MAVLRADGHDPAHGGTVAEKRRLALVRRRASGELIGSQLRKARLDALDAASPPPVAVRVPSPLPLSLGCASIAPAARCTFTNCILFGGSTVPRSRGEKQERAWDGGALRLSQRCLRRARLAMPSPPCGAGQALQERT